MEEDYDIIDKEPLRESFLLYASWYKYICTLSPRKQSQAYKAICDYCFFNTPIPKACFSATEYAALSSFRPTIEKHKRNYENGLKGASSGSKGGRPKSSRVQKKSRAVTIRYSALQYDIVRHRARTAGFRTLTEYVREASVNAEVVQNFIQEHNAVFRDLSGLCNNLNQLTRLAHTQGLQSTEVALSDLLPQVLNLITHLHKEMKRQK